jgi:hypothetical protein
MSRRGNKPSADAIDHYTKLALERGGTVTGHGPIEPPPAPAPEPPDEVADEAAFQKAVTDLFEENGWKWFHVNLPKRSKIGWPDLVLVKHRVVVAELKVGDNQPTAAQVGWLEAFQAAGVDSHCWRPSDWPEIVAIATEKPTKA